MQRSPRSQSVQAHSPSLNIGRRSESPLPLPPLPAIQTDLPHRTHGYGLEFIRLAGEFPNKQHTFDDF